MSDLQSFVNVEAARAAFGETEYTYHRIPVTFSSGRKRGQAKHYSGTPVECSKEEYDAKHEEGHRLDVQRFVEGAEKFRRDFSRYSRTVTKPGWREKLIELIQQGAI